MKYIYIVVILCLSSLNAQEIKNDSIYQNFLSLEMSNHALDNVSRIYRLSIVYPPAQDSLKSIIRFLDEKIDSRKTFSESDKYTRRSYGVEGDDFIKDDLESKGEVALTFVRTNVWSDCIFRLNIATGNSYYSSDKICEKLENLYCSLSHNNKQIYIEQYGKPELAFYYLLENKKYSLFKEIIEEDFKGILNDGDIYVWIDFVKSFISNSLKSYNMIIDEAVNTQPQVKKFYITVLNYLEWDNDLETMKKVLDDIKTDFGTDTDFTKYRNMVE